jgi:hypothetical protein
MTGNDGERAWGNTSSGGSERDPRPSTTTAWSRSSSKGGRKTAGYANAGLQKRRVQHICPPAAGSNLRRARAATASTTAGSGGRDVGPAYGGCGMPERLHIEVSGASTRRGHRGEAGACRGKGRDGRRRENRSVPRARFAAPLKGLADHVKGGASLFHVVCGDLAEGEIEARSHRFGAKDLMSELTGR